MLKPRIIHCLLIRDKGLVKTKNFKPFKYIGDPINAVRIFNEKEVDELVILDIYATIENREPNYNKIKEIDFILLSCLKQCEKYYPAFQFLLWENKSPAQALEASLLDTKGEA